MFSFELKQGNNLEVLKDFPDNYFDAIVTDPPYGLGKEPNAQLLMREWIEKGYYEISGAGFMGKEWDAFVPQPIFWKEVFRVLKHGGHVLSFFGTRTYDWGVMAMRFAGFEVRDCIQWLYGSGFPKSYNVAKGIEGKIVNGSSSWNDWKKLDGEKEQVNWGYSKGQAEQGYRVDYSEANKERVGKVNFQSDQAKQWDGWGSALKPANEPIVLARKPLEKGLSIAENVLKWGTGGINIDGCKVELKNETTEPENYDAEARFPANILFTHHQECKCNGLNAEEMIEDWSCHQDCPIKILDEQTQVTFGNVSRFFYVAKASKSERNNGVKDFEETNITNKKGNGLSRVCNVCGTNIMKPCNCENNEWILPSNLKNNHPTVKPVKLMQYLTRLITPPNGIVLDPFCGSGTTGIACKLEGFKFVGIEQDPHYCKIAEARIQNYKEEVNLPLQVISVSPNQLTFSFE